MNTPITEITTVDQTTIPATVPGTVPPVAAPVAFVQPEEDFAGTVVHV